MSSVSIHGYMFTLIGFILLILLAVAQAKPSHPFGLHAIPDHFEALPPLLPPAHFHAVAPPPPPPPAAALFAAPAPLPLPAPAPVFAPAPLPPPIPATYFAAPVPAPLPLHVAAPLPSVHFAPAPVPAPLFAPAPLPPPVHLTKIVPPVIEALPFAVPAAVQAVPVAPSYRAVLGPKTTTHHVSVGYAFPAPQVAKIIAQPAGHSHLSTAPVSLGHSLHHKFHSLF